MNVQDLIFFNTDLKSLYDPEVIVISFCTCIEFNEGWNFSTMKQEMPDVGNYILAFNWWFENPGSFFVLFPDKRPVSF